MSLEVTALTSYITVVTNQDETVTVTTQNPSPSQTAILFEDEGTALGTRGTVNEIDFAGSGVTATRSGDKVTVTVSSGGGGGTWGSITGTLSNQTDLQTALNAKQATLVSATNIKTINGNTLLGSGDLSLSGTGDVNGPASSVDSSIVSFNSTSGKIIKDSGARIILNGTNGIKGHYLGYSAGVTTSITTADGFNTGLGYQALSAITDGANSYDASYNAAFGYQAGLSINTGASNTLIGYRAGRLLTNSIGSTAVGKDALKTATTASNNTAIGYQVLSLATGAENTGVGSVALQNVTTGVRNTAVGYICLNKVTTGQYNTAMGSESFEQITTQTYNTGLGFWAGVYTLGGANTFIGAYACGQATNLVTNQSGNTMVGYGSGLTDTAANASVTGDYNSFFGYQTGLGSTTQVSYSAAIGYRAKVYTDRSMVFGSEIDADRVNYGFGGESYGGGQGVMFIKNTVTNPGSNPTGGGILYVDAGALKYRGSSGTVTTIANA